MKTRYRVYKIENTETGQHYIGQTKHYLCDRRSSQVWAANNKPKTKLDNAIAEYGKQAFKWTTLEMFDNPYDATKAEADYMKEYNAVTHGYNSRYPTKRVRNGGGSNLQYLHDNNIISPTFKRNG